MKAAYSWPLGQRGASLIVSLVFVLILALLGATAASVTSLEERMAGDTRDRDLALQAAEAALRDAEARLQTDPAFRAAAVAFVANNANDASFWEDCFANETPPCLAADKKQPAAELPTPGDPGAVAQAPIYIVEKKPNDGTTEVYRVTTRSVGGSTETAVILQTEFGYTPAP